MKKKANGDVLEALKSIINKNKLFPSQITSDNGPEFVNDNMEAYLEKIGVYHNTSLPYSPNTTGAIERYNKTIKSMIYKYMGLTDDVVWVDVLGDIVENYNNTEHRMTGYPPNNVDKYTFKKVIEGLDRSKFDETILNENRLKRGDIVRVVLRKEKFDKKIKERFSEKLYRVVLVLNGQMGIVEDLYKIETLEGEPVKKEYTYSQLQKVGNAPVEFKSTNRKKIESEATAGRRLALELGEDRDKMIENVERVKENKPVLLNLNLTPRESKRVSKPVARFGEEY